MFYHNKCAKQKTVELLMGNAESLRHITDCTQKQESESVSVDEVKQEPEQEKTVGRSKGRGI